MHPSSASQHHHHHFVLHDALRAYFKIWCGKNYRNTITITLFFMTHLELILRIGAVKTTDSNSSCGSVSILPTLNLFKNVSQSQLSDVVRKCTCSQHVTSTVTAATISSTFGTKGRRKCYKSPHPPTRGIRRRYKSWSSTSIKASRLPFPKEKKTTVSSVSQPHR